MQICDKEQIFEIIRGGMYQLDFMFKAGYDYVNDPDERCQWVRIPMDFCFGRVTFLKAEIGTRHLLLENGMIFANVNNNNLRGNYWKYRSVIIKPPLEEELSND